MIADFFDADSEPIVRLEAFYGPKKHLVDKCLIIFSSVLCEQMRKEHECEQIAVLTACNGSSRVWAFEHSGEKVAFYLTQLGSALAGAMVEEVNHLTGASTFIMFGSCGSLDGDATRGRFILPTEAYRGEGMSFYYAAPSDYIKIRNCEKLSSLFTELKIPFVKGRVWTTESMLRETVNLVRRRKEEGCIAVEMELAGVQAVCDFNGFELYDFLAPGDVLAEEGYEAEELQDANHNLDKLQIALKICERI